MKDSTDNNKKFYDTLAKVVGNSYKEAQVVPILSASVICELKKSTEARLEQESSKGIITISGLGQDWGKHGSTQEEKEMLNSYGKKLESTAKK